MDSKKFAFELKEKVKDDVTGLEYVIVGRVEYVTYVRYDVQPTAKNRDGEPLASLWVDEDRLSRVE